MRERVGSTTHCVAWTKQAWMKHQCTPMYCSDLDLTVFEFLQLFLRKILYIYDALLRETYGT